MDFYPSSSNHTQLIGYGSHSAVLAHQHYPQEVQYYIAPAPVRNTTITRSYHVIPQVSSSTQTQTQNSVVRKSQIDIPRDPFHAEQYQPSRGTSAKIPRYNPLDDPHMQDYYSRKFGKRAKSMMKRSSRLDTLYRITVKTADEQDAGTNAKVYLSIFGSRDKICRKYLTRESMLRGQSASLNHLNKITENDINNIEFKRGATDIVYVRCRDLGIIHHIILEHTGMLFEQSWKCEFITITNVRTSRSWLFPCNKWLSLFEPGDGSLAIELYPDNYALFDRKKPNTPKDTDYEIVIVTGDERGAGTDSQVHVVLFGSQGRRTEKLHLKTSKNHKNPFERNQSDRFVVRGDYIGDLVKMKIEHDNSGRAPGWFLDRVVVTDLYEPKVIYHGTCHKWLAKDEGDGQISRDIQLRKHVEGTGQNNQYKVKYWSQMTSSESDDRGAGTDADVSITLHGAHGNSGSIMLNAKKSQFESGSVDEFMIECPNVGELTKILIGHNNKGSAPGWFLDRVLVEDMEENRIYEFTCNRWLATDEDDGQISRFLFPKKTTRDGREASDDEGIPYKITVYTGEKTNAGTDAEVHIVMHRKKNSSNKIILSGGKFEQKSIDEFIIDGPTGLSPLSALDIGHDNSGTAPGWFLDKVVVDCPSTGITQTFPCRQWLAKDEGDGRIERRLEEDLSLRVQRPPTIPWCIWVYTSDMKGAGTDAQVKLVLYGRDGKTDEVTLKSDKKAFEAGACDEFKENLDEVGIPVKLRVQHDNSRSFAAWHLDRIEMQNMNTGDRFHFPCGRWLSKKDDDKSTIRELPAEGPGIKKPLPLVKYFADVYTGNVANAGTDANVFLNIFGETGGDTGERPLEYPLKKRNKFEKNQMDTFAIEAVLLSKLTKVRIGHDGSGPGAGWFLDKVVIRCENERSPQETFVCNRWLAEDEDDGLVVRELKADSGTQDLDKTTYRVRIKTGDITYGGTDADVYLKIFGKRGDSDKVMLRAANNTSNKFERGQIDKFDLQFEDLGKLLKIQIGHNGKNPGAGWFLDWVEIDVPSRSEMYRFACHRWLDIKQGDKKIDLELEPSEVTKKHDQTIPYEITVFTGNKTGAGTDANVFIQLYGLKGKTEEIKLKNKSDSFEKNKKDTFKVDATDVGQIQKIRIGHDNSKMNAAWYLEKVLIQRHVSEDSYRPKKGFKSDRSIRLSQLSAKDSNVEEYWFFCQKWLDSSNGDRQIVRELLPTDENGNPLSRDQEIEYQVHVFTGDKSGAGTDSNVFLTIYGEFFDSGERPLAKSNNRNKFERKQEDIFTVKAVALGRLRKIKIRHDNAGGGSAWYLDRVEIVDPQTNDVYHFVCQGWLSDDADGGMLSREIPASEDAAFSLARAREAASRTSGDYALERKVLAHTYLIHTFTSTEFGSGTNANVYIIIYGDREDTGKVPLARSKTHKDPFENGHEDIFEFEDMDVGEPRKIKIGHDNAGFRADWLLERVEIEVPKLGRTWVFPCGKWISKSRGEHQLEVELYPKDMATDVFNPRIPYEIIVYTSKKSGAGTDANVFIEIYGQDATTGEIKLCEKTERKGKFQTGSVDKFVRELDDVGETIEKIRIGHDNSGYGAAWHLDRVEIRQMVSGKKSKTYIFPCDRWFSKKEDDRQIVRELIPDKVVEEKVDRDGKLKVRELDIEDRLEMKNYKVDVYTGDKWGAGTDANVFCTIFGDKGDSGERELSRSETHGNKFERKQKDRFTIESADLGNVYKMKIRHDNKGGGADWYLDRVEVIDDVRTFVFHCENWLGKKEGDGKIERTLYEKDYQGSRSSLGSVRRSVGGSMLSLGSSASDQKNEPFRQGTKKNIMSSIREEQRAGTDEGISYTVKVKTGSAKDAGTSAHVLIRLTGRKGRQTEWIPLELMSKKRFEPGKVETFSLQEADIGDLEVVDIEHDGETDADSWFLEDITIEIPTKGKVYYFHCAQWLSKHRDDGKTRRTLRVQDSNQGHFRPLVPYEVTIITGDTDTAGTDCDVTLKLFGTEGSSADHVVRKEEGMFERGTIDRFICELDDVGKPVKVRLTIVPKSRSARKKWYVENVELIRKGKRNEPQETFFFGLNDWISKETEYFKDIPVSTKNNRPLMNKTTYRITTKTSNIDGAGCDSNVFIVLSGQYGDSGELKLENSSTYRNKFERDHEDVFTFDDRLSLGELTRVRIWHDNSSWLKSPWHLEYVKVEDTNTNRTYMFPCKKWLSAKHDDKQIVRELTCADDSLAGSRLSLSESGKIPYEIEVTTSDKQDAGTTQNGWLIIEGKRGQSDRFMMKNTPHQKILRTGQTDTFPFESRPLGDLRRIILGHRERKDYPLSSREGRRSQWHVAGITITDPTTGMKYEFPVRQWLELNGDGETFECREKKEDAVIQQRHRQPIKYKIIVHTGDASGAGTDANVSIILYGTLGDTGKRELKQKGRNLFEKAQVDEFTIESLDLGDLTKLHIEHDNAMLSPDWLLDKVEVINTETGAKTAFPCNRWLGKKHDDGEIQRDLLPIQD